MDTDFDVPIQVINQWIELNLEAETYPTTQQHHDSSVSSSGLLTSEARRGGAGAELCTIRFLALLDSSEHPGMTIL